MSEFKTSTECVEHICGQGCHFVREVIVRIESNETIVEFEHLEIEQQQQVLIELKTIMSVYDLSDES